MINIKNNLDILRNKLNEHKDVQLVAVTKNQSIDKIKEAIKYGVTDIGENKVQELIYKYDELKDDVNFHMIGHLQRNKVKYIIDKVILIHSVDNKNLLEEIDKRAKQKNLIMDILIQVNISKESTKKGFYVEEVIPFLYEMSKYKNVKVKGLMTIAPRTKNIKLLENNFKDMKNLSDEIKKIDIGNVSMDILSMGMTNDYLVALDYGANIIRLGNGIFGKRNY